MALVILDGNQSATTLSTIVVSSAHIPAHTVVSLGTQAITDIVNATSAGLTNTQLRASVVTVGGTVTIGNSLTIGGGTVTIGAGTAQIGSVTASISGTVPISISSVTIGSAGFAKSTGVVSMPTQAVLIGFGYDTNQNFVGVNDEAPLPVEISLPIPAGTNRIGVVTIGAGTVTIGAGTAQIGSVTASISGTIPISIASVTIGNTVTISGTVTSNLGLMQSVVATEGIASSSQFVKIGGHQDGANATAHIVHVSAGGALKVDGSGSTQPVSLASLPSLVAGTAQIGSVTASISGTVPISISSVTVGNSVTIGSLPAISGTVTATMVAFNADVASFGTSTIQAISDIELDTIRASIWVPAQSDNAGSASEGNILSRNNPMPVHPAQGNTVTKSNFTSTTPSTSIVSFLEARRVLSVFNEGAGNLHISAGATCTTISYQVRLSAGDYWECPAGQLSMAHTAVFATAGTARVTQVG